MVVELYIARLPVGTDFDQVIKLVKGFGECLQITIATGPTYSIAKVAMVEVGAAAKAAEALNGSDVDGSTIEVRVQPLSEPLHETVPARWGLAVGQLHVTNLPPSATKRRIKALFADFPVGTITINKSKQEAFVQIASDLRGLQAAVGAVNGKELDRQTISVAIVPDSLDALWHEPKRKPR